jgi:hypothetical protein
VAQLLVWRAQCGALFGSPSGTKVSRAAKTEEGQNFLLFFFFFFF